MSALPHRATYPFIGALLALGSPLGYFVLRALMSRTLPTGEWAWLELQERADAYAYMTLATTVVLAAVGRYLGADKDRLRSASLTDALTELPNRRNLEEGARASLSDESQNASLLLIDLDGLKQINDAGGHLAGDAALRAVARVVRSVCRRGDIYARYGGDEFVVILPRTDTEVAMSMAQRICNTPSISVSVGVTDCERAKARTLSGLILSADHALREAKLQGKRRACLS